MPLHSTSATQLYTAAAAKGQDKHGLRAWLQRRGGQAEGRWGVVRGFVLKNFLLLGLVAAVSLARLNPSKRPQSHYRFTYTRMEREKGGALEAWPMSCPDAALCMCMCVVRHWSCGGSSQARANGQHTRYTHTQIYSTIQ
jgi:hypothetical protein